MDEGASKTSSAKEAITPSCEESSSATNLAARSPFPAARNAASSHSTSVAFPLNDGLEALDTFFDTRTPAHQKQQRSTAETLNAAIQVYDDETCRKQG